jgi:FlaA1/EpsC-like NDP-sugar epimerase
MIYLTSLSRTTKWWLFFFIDLVLLALSLGAAFVLRYGSMEIGWVLPSSWLLFPAMLFVGAGLIAMGRLPWIKLHAMESRSVLRIAAVACALSVAAIVLSYLLRLPTPWSVPLILGAVFFLSSVTVRLVALNLLQRVEHYSGKRSAVVIYGAGSTGVQLASSLHQSGNMRPVAFVDDDPALRDLMVAGLPVYGTSALEGLIRRHKVARVLLALPSVPQSRIDDVLARVKTLGVDVQALASYAQILSEKRALLPLPRGAEDTLLGHGSVDLGATESVATYKGRVVMVTGAGGRVGAELCRQLIACAPARVILFDHSEKALQDARDVLAPLAAQADVMLVARLGSVVVSAQVAGVMTREGVDVVLHAAAHTDARLGEDNPLEALQNNVLGTQVVSDAAMAAGVGLFVLLSGNKTLRPVTVLDAAQRFAEWVVQDRQMRSDLTRFAIVRFGNVHAEAGSLIALFRKQIAAGGPVTVPHLEMSRRVMTLSHAARMILRGSAFAKGGEVFILDPGSPQNMAKIARRTIEMSGRRVAEDTRHPDDIVLKVSGLRPGEALSEPPLAEYGAVCGTPCASILQIKEVPRSEIEVAAFLREINACITNGDADRLRGLMQRQSAQFHAPVAKMRQFVDARPD